MSWRFYAGWACAVVLALVLPVAIPYAIWPQHEGPYDDDDMIAECGRVAEIAAGGYPASLWALSSEVQSCSRDEAGVLIYSAKVIAHGPYGIPFATATVTPRDINWHDMDRGAGFGLAALIAGVVAVSIPFALVPIRAAIRRHPAPA